jgi:cobalt-zinc-cadmium efflux system membrane fusion protein
MRNINTLLGYFCQIIYHFAGLFFRLLFCLPAPSVARQAGEISYIIYFATDFARLIRTKCQRNLVNSFRTTALILITLTGLPGYGYAQETITLSATQISNLGIKLGKLEPVQQIPLLYAPAKVVIPPEHEYIVSAALAGLITQLSVAIGDPVEKGQVLAVINSPELLTLQRQYLKANSERSLALATYRRDKKLFAEGVISDRRWQETRTRYNGYVSAANEAQQLLEIAGMSTESIKHLVTSRRLGSQLKVHSPIAGTVLQRMVVAGERIDMLAPVYRIADLEQLWLEINIPHERIGDINIGDRVVIENTSATARISLLGQSVNPLNQTVLVRAVIDVPHADIRSGQSVNARIVHDSGEAVFRVPDTAIAQKAGQTYVFSRSDNGFLVKQVKVLGQEGNNSIITGVLTRNEEIAVTGAVALKAHWMGLGEGGEE